MSVISTKTIPGSMASRMSANPAQLDELNFDRVKNYSTDQAFSKASTFQPLVDCDIQSAGNNTYNGNGGDCVLNDDRHVYANLSEIVKHEQLEDIDRRPNPPIPDEDMEPVRITMNGWREYKTLGGRSYYYNPQENICQWKPPRSKTRNLSTFSGDNACEPSTSSAELFAEISLRNEYDQACCSSDKGGDQDIPEGMVLYHSALMKASEDENELKKLMSCSVNGDLSRHHPLTTFRTNNVNSAHFIEQDNNLFSTISAQSTTPVSLVTSAGQSRSLDKFKSPEIEQSVINALSQNRFSATPIRQGTLEKCKLSECGVKVKKKEWLAAYAYLYSSHLLFYKDQKSAEKTGKHYPPPTDVCDLRGAILSYVDTDKQKEKRRKHVISLILISKTEYLFSCAGSESDINGWFHALRQTISLLPSVQSYPLPPLVDYGGSLQRSSLRNKKIAQQSAKNNIGGSFGAKSSLHHSVMSKLRTAGSKDNVDPTNNLSADFTSTKQMESSNLTRESIIERLLRFFRSRPSMESLRERGIYKPEPVFGSTLSAICTHEKSLFPRFLAEVTRLIEEKGLDIDGLYRVNGNLSSVQKIRCQIDQDKYEALCCEDDVHVLTGALKLFFRELSEPIFPISMNREFMSAIREPNSRLKFKAIDELLLRLPKVNRETLKLLLFHLDRVASHSGKNRMQIHNLAIMFGPTLFGTEDRISTNTNAGRRNSGDTKGRSTKRKTLNGEKKEELSSPMQSEPNQNLAYKMVVYGQIVEFILNECKKFTIFQKDSSTV